MFSRLCISFFFFFFLFISNDVLSPRAQLISFGSLVSLTWVKSNVMFLTCAPAEDRAHLYIKSRRSAPLELAQFRQVITAIFPFSINSLSHSYKTSTQR